MKEFLESAIAAAQKAAAVHHHYQAEGFEIETKSSDYDLVTTADKKAEEVIIDHLSQAYPNPVESRLSLRVFLDETRIGFPSR
jgi:fructose-1,6-bisphosphatase/inositol monophosphatase family enzyme